MFNKVLVGLAAVAAIAAPSAASAAIGPVAQINIAFSPQLTAKTKDYGQRDFDILQDELRRSVERELSRKGALNAQGGVLDLVVDDARETRPTFQQLTHRTGLSLQSASIGGVEISGTYRAPDGAITPLKYRWYATDLRDAFYGWTWQAAAEGFRGFARTLVRS